MSNSLEGYMDDLHSSNLPFISNDATIEWYAEYMKEYKTIDDYFAFKYLSRDLKANFNHSPVGLTVLARIIKGLMLVNRYKYDTLYKTMLFDYNPIENYNRIEESTVKDSGTMNNRTGTDTSVNSGTDSITNDTTNTMDYNTTDTDTNVRSGSEITTNVKGQETVDTSNSVVPWEEKANPRLKDTVNVVNGDRTDTQTDVYNSLTDARTVSHNGRDTNNVINTVDTNYGMVNTLTHDVKDEKDMTQTTTSNIHGNIGVMSTQQMLELERQVALFSFLEIVFTDIFEVILNPIIDLEV